MKIPPLLFPDNTCLSPYYLLLIQNTHYKSKQLTLSKAKLPQPVACENIGHILHFVK
jgi:hypothetical protein